MRHTGTQLNPEASLSFACQARASGLLLEPGKTTESNGGSGSAPGDTKQFLLTLTPQQSQLVAFP